MSMPTWLQHVIVVSIALACAVSLAVRRVRALARGKACDGCAQGACAPAPGRDVPIPPSALLKRRG
jgi:hypothetical protein